LAQLLTRLDHARQGFAALPVDAHLDAVPPVPLLLEAAGA
jgi:hypothetical protein